MPGMAPTSFNGRARGQSFQTIAVIGTIAWKWIAHAIMGDANVAHLGMQPAMQQTAIDQRASAQACSNRDIEEAAQTARGAPTGLGQRGGVHIGIENNRRPERPANCPGKIEVLPGRFWRGGDVTEQGRFRIRIDRSERSDSNGRHRLAGPKEVGDPRDGLVRRGSWKLGDLGVIGAAARRAQKLRSPELRFPRDAPFIFKFTSSWSFRAPGFSEARFAREPGTIKASMRFTAKLSPFGRILALSGFAAAAIAQQPSSATPPKTSTPPSPALTSVTAPEANLAPDAVVLTIGDQRITRAQFEVLLSALAQNGHPAASPAQKRQVAEQYADLETMAQEARKRKLD